MSTAGADADPRGFGSDNHSGAHPEVLAAIEAANAGHAPAYGEDRFTAALDELFREHFGPEAQGIPGLQRHRRQPRLHRRGRRAPTRR